MSTDAEVNRRDFLRTTMKTTAGLTGLSGITFLPRPERVFGANDRVRVAVSGLHLRGKDHLVGFSRVPNVEIAALCDVDESVLNKRRREVAGNPQTLWMSASCWRTSRSTPFPLLRLTIGIP
jgi:hypothetical protein